MPEQFIEPRVTALIMTYNHATFITQAIDSALMQETSFPFEILITEDCSTDGTREIVQEYANRHPERIRLSLSPQNLHSNEVIARGIRAARGEYIALLDGDDYWTSVQKLQRQVEFLDTHPDCNVCFHQATVRDEQHGAPDWNWTPEEQKPITRLSDIFMGNYIATCSTMFRKAAVDGVPEWYCSFPVTDWPLHVLSARDGNIGYINETMGVYRYHSGGAYSGFSEERKQDETFRIYRIFNRELNYRYDHLIRAGLFTYFFEWAEEYLRRGEREKAWRCFTRSLQGRPPDRIKGYSRAAKLGVKLLVRGLVSRQEQVQ